MTARVLRLFASSTMSPAPAATCDQRERTFSPTWAVPPRYPTPTGKTPLGYPAAPWARLAMTIIRLDSRVSGDPSQSP